MLQFKKVNSLQKSISVRKMHQEVVIVGVARTPFGSFNGKLASLNGPELGAIAIKGALEKANLSPREVKEVILGNVLSANVGQAPARQASLKAGLGEDVPCTTINKVCSSSIKSITLGAQSIMLGISDCSVTGGFESMSNSPYYLDKGRSGYKYGHGQVTDAILKDGLWDVYNNIHMGMCAEDCATRYKISREDQDAYAIESYRRAAEAYKLGFYKSEIIPVTIPQKQGNIVVNEDEEYKNIKLDKVSTLKPVFKPDGTVTAANASSVNDGGTAVILMSASRAKQLGIKPLAKILGFGDAEHAPIQFPTAPSKAIPKALAHAGIKQSNVDYYEINEAFSVVSIVNNQLLGLDPTKVSVWGGAVSLGHPIGASGARLVITLINVLKQKKGKIGVAGICNGGGGATALVIENLD